MEVVERTRLCALNMVRYAKSKGYNISLNGSNIFTNIPLSNLTTDSSLKLAYKTADDHNELIASLYNSKNNIPDPSNTSHDASSIRFGDVESLMMNLGTDIIDSTLQQLDYIYFIFDHQYRDNTSILMFYSEKITGEMPGIIISIFEDIIQENYCEVVITYDVKIKSNSLIKRYLAEYTDIYARFMHSDQFMCDPTKHSISPNYGIFDSLSEIGIPPSYKIPTTYDTDRHTQYTGATVGQYIWYRNNIAGVDNNIIYKVIKAIDNDSYDPQ